jgi:hypothetical protein
MTNLLEKTGNVLQLITCPSGCIFSVFSPWFLVAVSIILHIIIPTP